MKNGTEAVLEALHSVPFCFLFSELNSQSYFNERYVIAIVILAHYTVEAESVLAYPLGVYIRTVGLVGSLCVVCEGVTLEGSGGDKRIKILFLYNGIRLGILSVN